MAMNSDVWIWENLCTVPSNCNIIYSREYTPLLYALSLPVTYYGAEFGFVVDPKNALAYRTLDKDLPFKEARIDGKVLDLSVMGSTSIFNFKILGVNLIKKPTSFVSIIHHK
jgi:hypothetical protein